VAVRCSTLYAPNFSALLALLHALQAGVRSRGAPLSSASTSVRACSLTDPIRRIAKSSIHDTTAGPHRSPNTGLPVEFAALSIGDGNHESPVFVGPLCDATQLEASTLPRGAFTPSITQAAKLVASVEYELQGLVAHTHRRATNLAKAV
jgi:hypothetical protein